MACLKALSGGSPMVPWVVCVDGYCSVCGRLSLGLGWPVPLGSVSVYCEQGRVSVVFVLYLRPMAHWKALSKGFPMVPGAARVPAVLRLDRRPMVHWKALSEGFPVVPRAVSVDGWFSVRGRLSLGLG
eukprot:scaffold5984_cov137-Isochrysis_galbana.AAC.2